MVDQNAGILLKYKETFSGCFIKNCQIDADEVTSEELETLEELDDLEVFENMNELITELLAFKNEAKKSDKFELIQRCEQFETMLQKLEAEIEQQLKLHIDACQARIDELEKATPKYNQKIKILEEKVVQKNKEIAELMRSISPTPKDLSSKIKFLEDKCKDDFSKTSTQHTYQRSDTLKDKTDRSDRLDSTRTILDHKPKLPEMNGKKPKYAGNKIEQECWRLKVTIDEKNRELEKLKKEMEKLNKELKLFKDKRPIQFFKHSVVEKPTVKSYKHIRTQSDRATFTERNNRDTVDPKNANLELDTFKRTLSSSNMKKLPDYKVQVKRKPASQHNRSSSDTFRTNLQPRIL